MLEERRSLENSEDDRAWVTSMQDRNARYCTEHKMCGKILAAFITIKREAVTRCEKYIRMPMKDRQQQHFSTSANRRSSHEVLVWVVMTLVRLWPWVSLVGARG
jgi:hypothetical protein